MAVTQLGWRKRCRVTWVVGMTKAHRLTFAARRTARHTEGPMLVPISFYIVGREASGSKEKMHLGGGTRFRVNTVFTQGLGVYSG
jgi:hypothetical protein